MKDALRCLRDSVDPPAPGAAHGPARVWERPRSWSRSPGSAMWGWCPIPSPTIPVRVPWDFPLSRKGSMTGQTYSVTEYTMSEIIASVYEKMEETGLKRGDSLSSMRSTACLRPLAPTMLQFLQCKTFGNQKVPEGWVIVAAGNPPEYNKSVRDFDVVTLDRVKRSGRGGRFWRLEGICI